MDRENKKAFLTVTRLAPEHVSTWSGPLQNGMEGFLREIGEDPMDEKGMERLTDAIQRGRIIFFLAEYEGETVGMCSVSPSFSTFCCGEVGTFDDFYVIPAYRHKGVARFLAETAQKWCKAKGLVSLTVGCSPGDVGMYKALGFGEELGIMLAHII